MVIKRSSAREIDALLADLSADSDVRREAAIARLAVIGSRAVDRLIDVLQHGPSTEIRVAALQALEPVDDPRALDAALACLGHGENAVSVQAVHVVRRRLSSGDGPRIIDRLAAIALDPERPQALRLSALDALTDMQERTVQPIWRRLMDDPDPLVGHRARVALGLEQPERDPLDLLDAAASGRLPESPGQLRTAIASSGATSPLPTLHRILEVLRASEHSAGEASRVMEWRRARAELHRVLASRGSTVALYDLRETLERADRPLPVEFVEALAAIGDRTCIAAIAEAYEKAPAVPGGRDWWRSQLASAFRDIVRRESLTERHAAIKQVRTRWPAAATTLLGPPRGARR